LEPRDALSHLFADVKGAMELAEKLDPEEWSPVMQRFFRMLSDGRATDRRRARAEGVKP
jgi:class 3 adenylate cyclase